MGVWLFASIVVAMTGAAIETGVARAAPDAERACELHAWPAPPMQMLSEGLLFNHKVDQQLAPVRRLYADGGSPLDTARQVALLRAADLTRLFNRPGIAIVVHDEPAPRRQPGAARSRRTAATAHCYTELVVGRLFYTKNALSRASLRILFSVEDYTVDPTPRFTFSGFGDADLTLFPPATPEAAKAADAELADAFTTAFHHFAAQASRRRTEAH